MGMLNYGTAFFDLNTDICFALIIVNFMYDADLKLTHSIEIHFCYVMLLLLLCICSCTVQ